MKSYNSVLPTLQRATSVLKCSLLFLLLLPFSSPAAVAQDVTLSPSSLSWGPVSVGQTSGAKTITLANVQSVPLTISSISISGDFLQTATNCPVKPATLAANTSCTISLAFRPLATGTRSGSLTVTDDAPSSPQTLTLSGTGATGPVIFSPSSLSFPTTAPGSTSAPQTATLTNTQATAVNIASITASAQFAQTNNCPSSLPANGSCSFSVTFAPTSNGNKSGSVNANLGSSLLQLYVSGTAGNVIPPGVTLSPAQYTFSTQTVGTTSAPKNVTLTNGQSTALAISSIQISAPFAQTNNCASSVPSNGTCTIALTYAPTAVGNDSATLIVNDDATDSPQTGAISGNAVAGNPTDVTFSPTSLSWGSVPVGQTSGAQTITLTNAQSVPLKIASLAVSGDFLQTATTCPLTPSTVAAGANCTISIAFRPQSTGAKSGALTVTDDAPSSPQTVRLSGTGSTGQVLFSPTSLNFPTTASGSTSPAQTATLTNTQSTAVTISSISATAQFTQTNNCPSSLPGNGSCTITVSFAPTSVGSKTGSVNVSLGSASYQLNLAGMATSQGPTGGVTLSPKQITFPNQATGTTSATMNVTLTNGQSAALAISSIQLSPPFYQTNNCGSSVPSGGTCTIALTYAPTATGFTSSTLTVNDNATNSPQTAALSGNAVAAVTTVPVAGGLGFFNQIVNTASTPLPVTITNNQSVALTINSITSTADFPFTTSCVGSGGSGTVAPGASCTINVSFDPQAIGSRSANITVNESAFGSPLTIPLIGKGIAGDPGITVTVGPFNPCAAPSGQLQFNAIVTGTSNTAVKWYVDTVLGGNAGSGTISASGLYTAPGSAGTHNIRAVSQASISISGNSTVNVTTAPVFAIYPFTTSLPPGAQQTFQAQICYVPDTNPVTFTVDNIAGGNSTVGTITSSGVYTAPAVAGKHTVRVTDASLGKTSGGVATIFSAVTVDFGSRTNTARPIPANMLGTGRGESLHSTADRALLAQAGVTVSRLYAQIPLVYATQTPDWTKIDPMIASIQAAGMRPMIQMADTPSWLQPNPNTCGAGNTFVTPTDINKWAQIAASFVAHFDATFPNFVQDYEIWNEPNSSGLCSSNRIKDYMAIYAAAASAMKQQAANDSATIRVGGPVLSGYSATWIQTLLSTPSTFPYVDFVSYHQYTYGQTALNVQWDTYNGNNSIYQETQDPNVGAAAVYNKVAGLLKAGQQPLGAKTPIYVTEYNTNWAFFQDCCKNDPTYGPLFNALYISDMLNNTYSSTAPMAPGKLVYFAGNAYPYFCLIGVPDQNNDCLYSSGASPQPYPQYFAYDLLSSTNYLGLVNGGYMAASINPPTGAGGPVIMAFYNTTQDAILITNPTSSTYSNVPVTMQNVGFGAPQATLYQIVNGASINSSSLALKPQGTTYSATISIPPYSVQAISLKGQ